MKKSIFLIALILFSGHFLVAQTWDVLDKSMAAYNQNDGATNNQAWAVAQGSSAASVTTQHTSYVTFLKTNVGSTARWAWVRPATALANVTPDTPYSIEVKARVSTTNIADNATNFEANQISLRLGSKNTAARIYLKPGDGVTSGYVSTSSGGTVNAYRLNTTEWQVYRLVLHADHLKFDVYIAGVDEPILENMAVNATGDQNGVYFGAESYHRCNIDVEYAKMGTGDFFSKPRISTIALSQASHVSGNESTVSVTANTALIENGKKILISLIDGSNNVIVSPVEATVTDNVASTDLVIPASVAEGQYLVKVIASEQIAGWDVAPKTAAYTVLDNTQTDISNIIEDEIIKLSTSMLNAGQALSVKTVSTNVLLSEVAVYSLTGNKVYRKSISANEISFNAPSVAGMYLLTVRLADNTSKGFKILVK
jgi:hypothetical protein